MGIIAEAEAKSGDFNDYDKKLKKALKKTLAEDIKTARAKLSDKRLKAKLKKREARMNSDDDEEGPQVAVLGSGGSN
jgi:exonuclease I